MTSLNKNSVCLIATLVTASIISATLLASLPATAQSAAEYCGMAYQLYKQNKTAEAVSILDQAQQLDANLADTYYIRGLILFHSQNRLDEAKQNFDRAIALNPQFAVAYAERAVIYDKQHKFVEGIADMTKAIQLRPDVYSNYESRGKMYADLGKGAEALRDFDQCLKLKPDETKVLTLRGLFLTKQKKWEQALPDLARVIAVSPSADAYNNRGWTYFKAKKYDEAMADYNHALGIDANYWRAYQVRGYIYQVKQQPEAGILNLNKALELKPANGDSLEARGLCFEDLGNWDTAIRDYTDALKGNPEDRASVLTRRGVLYHKKSQYAKAEIDFNASLKLAPKDSTTILWRARCFRDSNRTSAAIADYTSVLKIEPTSQYALIERAKCYQQRKERDLAFADYATLLKHDPHDRQALMARAAYYRELGEDDKALADYSAIVKHSPDDGAALAARSRIYFDHNDMNAAIAEESKIIQEYPESASAWRRRAYAHYLNNDLTKAVNDLNVATNLSPRNAQTLLCRALVNIARGNYSQSMADCDQVLKLVPKPTDEKDKGAVIVRALAAARRSRASSLLGGYKTAATELQKTIAMNEDNLRDYGELSYAEEALRDCRHIEAAVVRVKTQPALAVTSPEPKDEIEKSFECRVATRHFVFFSNECKDRVIYFAQFAETFHTYINNNLIKLADDKPTNIYLFATREKLQDFAQKNSLSTAQSNSDFCPERNAILNAGLLSLAPLAEKIMEHAIARSNIPLEPWALSGIPALFMKFYGYIDATDLSLYYGYENYYSLAEIYKTQQLRLSEILEMKEVKPRDTKARLLAVFLQVNDKLPEYIRLVQAGNKGTYKTFVEAAFEATAAELEPQWDSHLRWTRVNVREWLFLPPSEVFDSKAELQDFMHKKEIPKPGEIFKREGAPPDRPVAKRSEPTLIL